ncbi:MAG: hypothetical protein R3C11_19605 [Planctomycetaceae bacterium]
MATDTTHKSIQNTLQDRNQMQQAFREGLSEVIRNHKSLNLPLATWEEGQNGAEGEVVWVHPDEIDLDETESNQS